MPMAPKQVISVGDTLLAVDGERWSREKKGYCDRELARSLARVHDATALTCTHAHR